MTLLCVKVSAAASPASPASPALLTEVTVGDGPASKGYAVGAQCSAVAATVLRCSMSAKALVLQNLMHAWYAQEGNEGYDVYVNEPEPLNEGEEKHIISAFVADESGIINRVAGVFARRGVCPPVGCLPAFAYMLIGPGC